VAERDESLAPIVHSLELPLGPAMAFECFAGRFGEWWPVLTHSLARSEGTRCEMELREGGRVVEHAPGGEEQVWGSVTRVEPGRRLGFTWHPGREPESAQWVEVLFEPLGPGSRVTLRHGGWEALGEIAPILRREYVPGWRYVLGDCFAAFAREQK
jgi:uncharacterized protein YndB with AHSA1/START domain